MTLRIATLNVWALPGPFAREVDRRMRAIGARLPDLGLDAITFQEVWTAGARRRLLAAGRKAGLVHAWHTDAALGGSGLLVLSRLPFHDGGFARFALGGYPDRIDHADFYGGKGFVRLALQTRAGPLTLIDTHLHAPYASDVAHQYRQLRTGQAVELAVASREIGQPIVAVGDFNFEESQPEYRVLTGLSGLRDAAAEVDRRELTVWSGNAYRASRNPGKRVDYVFVRDGASRGVAVRHLERVFDEPIELSGRPHSYSDHAGVLAELEIQTRPGRTGPPAPEAIALAGRLLEEGRRSSEYRRRKRRRWAGMGLGVAAVAAAGVRTPALTRRRLLRGSVQALGFAALAPCVGLSVLSEVFVRDEIRAFDALAARVARLGETSGGVA